MSPHRARCLVALTLAIAGTGCAENPGIICTDDRLRACFGFELQVEPLEGNDTRVTILVQNLQGTIPQDNTAWSQLLYVRVYRNEEPSLGFPVGGDATPIVYPNVQLIGPGEAAAGWQNTGVNFPEGVVSEWIATGATFGNDGGYIAGRNQTYNEVANIGSGLRTFSGVGTAPGWVVFTFVAASTFTRDDINVEIAAYASSQPAAGLPVPQVVGCRVIGTPVTCIFHPYFP